MIKTKGISSSTLKFIAIVSMLIDHFAVAIYPRISGFDYDTYNILRGIGRIAFPIYCFLLIEGYFHTRDIRRYIGRCFMFAFISEIPFDMAVYGQYFSLRSQNIYFTLFLGLLVVYVLDTVKGWKRYLAIVVGAILAQVLDFDYHYMGILLIACLYFIRIYTKNGTNKLVPAILGAVAFGIYEIEAVAAFIPIYFYNGKRGLRLKYFFYWVYPVHLLIFGIIRMYLLQ